MKNRKRLLTGVIILVLAAVSQGSADPFLSIDSIDSGADFPLVTTDVSVNSRLNQKLSNVTADNFSVYEDGYKISFKISPYEKTGEYLYMVFSFDTSRSMSDKTFSQLKKKAGTIVRHASDNDKIALYIFNDEVSLKSNFSSDKSSILNLLRSIVRSGNKTLLYDSLYDSLNLLTEVSSEKRRLICFTDGKDEGSSVKSDDIVAFSKKHQIPVFFFSVTDKPVSDDISRIAKLTHGKVFLLTDSLDKTLHSVLTSSKKKFRIKYRSQIKPDGKKHSLEVRFTYDDIRDRTWKEFSIPVSRRVQSIISDNIFLIVIIFFLILFLLLFLLLIRRERRSFDRLSERDEVITRLSELIRHKEVNPVLSSVTDEIEDKEEFPIITGSSFLVKKNASGGMDKIPISGKEVFIGSDESCAVVVDDPNVSQQHAKLKFIGDGYHVMDMISESGTYLNDKKVLRPRRLYDWDEIRVGSVEFIFRSRLNSSS